MQGELMSVHGEGIQIHLGQVVQDISVVRFLDQLVTETFCLHLGTMLARTADTAADAERRVGAYCGRCS